MLWLLLLWRASSECTTAPTSKWVEEFELNAYNRLRRQSFRSVRDGPRSESTKLTIVTRSGFRPHCLSNLQASLAGQRNVHFQQVISNDAGEPGRDAVKAYEKFHPIKIIDMQVPKTKSKHCYSSTYLNRLYKHVHRDHWIMTLDDDARLVDADQLRLVRDAVAQLDPDREMLLQDALMWRQPHIVVYPNFTQDWGHGVYPKIDTGNVVFNKRAVDKFEFTEQCGGDKKMFDQLLSHNVTPVFLDQPKPGLWTNYDGRAFQAYALCNISELAGDNERALVQSRAYCQAHLQPNATELGLSIKHHLDSPDLFFRARHRTWNRIANSSLVAQFGLLADFKEPQHHVHPTHHTR